MTIRDLGYRPYEGERLAPSHNMTVMLRHGLKRAWGSWLVKIAVFVGWVPAVVGFAGVGIAFWITSQMGGQGGSAVDSAKLMQLLFKVQSWSILLMITLGAGAAVVAEDLTHRAFQFYFAKPVTPLQYLVGRTGAVGIYCFAFTFVPAIVLDLGLVTFSPADQRLERVGLLLPALLLSVIISTVLSLVSVGLSSLSKSRALTMTAWILLFIVPHVIALIVAEIGDWPWLYLASLPRMLIVVGDALFKIEPDDALRWYYAGPILAGIGAGAGYLAHYRLRRAEVIT